MQMRRQLSLAALILLAGASRTAAQDWPAVEHALGRSGAEQPGGVMKFGFPRSDLQVNVAGIALRPAFALGGWVAFKALGNRNAIVMGDLVLTEDEVGPVIGRLQAGGIEQTALHNHLLHESPRVMYLHVSAQGDAVKLAGVIRSALDATGTLAPARPAAASTTLDTSAIAHALGVAGKLNGVIYQVSVPRKETIVEGGHVLPPSMGVATAINFQPTGTATAAITGDFVLRPAEVNGVIRALNAANINVTALHSHMLNESPRLFFMHFWANDDAVKLATALHGALSRTNSRLAER